MRGDTALNQILKNLGRNAVIHDPFFVDGAFFGGIERRGIVLEILDQEAWILGGVENLGLALVNFFNFIHIVLDPRLRPLEVPGTRGKHSGMTPTVSFDPCALKDTVAVADVVLDIETSIDVVL